jgi:hypothetical protein
MRSDSADARAAAAAADDRLLAWLAAYAGAALPARDDAQGDGFPDEVVGGAGAALARTCPIVTGLLAFDQRLSAEINRQLGLRARPDSVAEWGASFARRLAADPDPWISWAAQVDAGTLAVEELRRRADPTLPGDPIQAILLIGAGTDPRV